MRPLIIILLLVACTERASHRRTGKKSPLAFPAKKELEVVRRKNGQLFLNPTIELRALVLPEIRTNSRLTIPKNYSGLLLLTGLNVAALHDRILEVRFKFGRELSEVLIPATIGRAKGLTPQTDIEVLIMDFRSRPLGDVRLLYDLYDYNKYTSTSTDIVVDPTNENLYCRGLRIEHDSTSSLADSQSCSARGDRCLYAYAKIRDSGLYSNTTSLAVIPTDPLIDIETGDFLSLDSTDPSVVTPKNAANLKKCLPDDGKFYYSVSTGFHRPTYTSVDTLATIGDIVMHVDDGTSTEPYVYKGPYRTIGESSWEISSTSAIESATAGSCTTNSSTPSGIFECSVDGSLAQGYKSYLFPRVGKLDLKTGVSYMGSQSTTAFDTRILQSLITPGDTNFMDGCNMRVVHYSADTGEGIGSCNVSALIEVVSKDPESNKYEVLASSKSVKLQLIRPSKDDTVGNEGLYQSFKSCSNGNTCSSNECCYNGRCWGKDLVSQCKEEENSDGRFDVGDSCTSDLQCTSLCCDRARGRCAVHTNNHDRDVFCSKLPGDQCIAKEWCSQRPTQKCIVVKTGSTVAGKATCALRCFTELLHGDCRAGTCIAPIAPDPEAFDPANPQCESKAQDAPLDL